MLKIFHFIKRGSQAVNYKQIYCFKFQSPSEKNLKTNSNI